LSAAQDGLAVGRTMMREILYRLLSGEQAARLRQIARADSKLQQISREYSRLFGAPPMRDIARLKASPDLGFAA
jgi:hypothetical protein